MACCRQVDTASACAIIGNPDGTVEVERRQFGSFKKDRRALADWCATWQPDAVVMESTGIYWKSPYAALEQVGIRAQVVNARHVKQVPGRKTDVGDAEWLAMLARAGLLRGSFVPPAPLRELRLIARQRQKLVGMLASEKNRLHKVLTDGGIRLGVVVSDIHGQSARAMIKALIQGATPQEVLSLASHRLKASREEILDALQGDLSACHRFVLDEVMHHIEALEAQIARFDTRLLDGLAPQQHALAGNPYVRRVLCECAHAASRTQCALRAKFQNLVVRRGHKRSIIALAHKMLRIIYFMLSRGTYYRDAATDYEALSVQRNAARWIKKLIKFGFLPDPA
ncbi:IS110 family transposase [Acidithiobacillus albertensis]|uniref:IS110 family transposase n=1 Tax=Acidithiobacillus albertensis TaxID=119978 RepID=UPI00094B70E7|nr:IS110 family transposase [Acidithiobacillus albertensis]